MPGTIGSGGVTGAGRTVGRGGTAGAGRTVGTVTGLARFPVKSVLGEDCFTLDFDRRGAVGDRLWAIRTEDGRLGSGKSTRRLLRVGGLLDCSAVYDHAVPVVVTPDGGHVRGDDPAARRRLSDLFNRPVALTRENDVWHMDAGSVSLVTTASLHALGDVDPRRFRPNIVIADDEPWAEEQWTGRGLAVGPSLRLKITAPIQRCVMVTMAQPGLPRDPALLRRLADNRPPVFGVYADVMAPGTVTLGDRCTME
jgi:MOSC domain-containing protein